VTHKLFAKLVTSEIIDRVLSEIKEQMPEANKFAAAKYIRKRRFGAFRLRKKDEKAMEKEKASMYRAGFSFGLVDDILKMNLTELEDIIFAAEKNI
jgi:regulatory protein